MNIFKARIKLCVKMKENIHDHNPQPMEIRVHGWGEYAQADFSRLLWFPVWVKLVSCKQEHWSSSMIVSRWRIDAFVFYSFVCRLRPERNNGNVGEVLAALRRAYWQAVRIDYLVRPQEERQQREWEITRGKYLKIMRSNGRRRIPPSVWLIVNFVFPSLSVLIFYSVW